MMKNDAQMAPRWHPDGPRGLQMASGGPKAAPGCSQEVPRWLRETPGWLQGIPGWPQDGPKRPQNGAKKVPRGLISVQAGAKMKSKWRIGDFQKTLIFLVFFSKNEVLWSQDGTNWTSEMSHVGSFWLQGTLWWDILAQVGSCWLIWERS